MTLTNGEIHEERILIPLKNGTKVRFWTMATLLIPGVVLFFAAVFSSSQTIGELLLRIFSLLWGMLVVFSAYQVFTRQYSLKWINMDTMIIYCGLLILVQGTMVYDPYHGFQLAHLLFIVSALAIFKGVIYPESRLIRGFLISEDEITYRLSHFTKSSSVSKKQLERITLSGNTLNFHMNDQTTSKVNLSAYEQKEIVFKELSRVVNEVKNVEE